MLIHTLSSSLQSLFLVDHITVIVYDVSGFRGDANVEGTCEISFREHDGNIVPFAAIDDLVQLIVDSESGSELNLHHMVH